MYISRSCSSCAPSAATMTRPMVHCKHNCRASGPASNFTARSGAVARRGDSKCAVQPRSTGERICFIEEAHDSGAIVDADRGERQWLTPVAAIRDGAYPSVRLLWRGDAAGAAPASEVLCAPGPHSRPPAWALGRLLDHGSRDTGPSEHSARRRRRCGQPRPGSPSPAGQGDVLAVLLRRLPAVFFW
jgi:hypothetical protein